MQLLKLEELDNEIERLRQAKDKSKSIYLKRDYLRAIKRLENEKRQYLKLRGEL